MVILASIIGFCAVAFGAFGAHALKDTLAIYGKEIWHTASLYALVHAPVLLWLSSTSHPLYKIAFISFFFGVLIFSGSLYALALSELKILGAITPIGGLLLLTGWILVAVAFYLSSRGQS